MTGVVPLDAGPLLPGELSPGLLTVAVLAASGLETFDDNVTSSSNIKLPLAGTEEVVVQVTFGTDPVQFHVPVELPLTL